MEKNEKRKLSKKRLEAINNNIAFFLKWADIVKIIMFILAGIILIIMLARFDELEGLTILSYIIESAILICLGFISEAMLKWKAYMLYTNLKSLD